MILIVDDEKSIPRIYGRILSAHGYEVGTAGSPQDALEFIRRNPPPDLILMDMGFDNEPDTDGWKLTSEIRALGYSGPVVAMSGTLVDDDPMFAQTVMKPMTLNELVELARRWIGAGTAPTSR